MSHTPPKHSYRNNLRCAEGDSPIFAPRKLGQSPASFPASTKRRGIVLIVVTVAILMISLAGLGFVTTMSTEHKAVHAQGSELQLAGLIGSGAEALAALLEQSPETRQRAGGLLDNHQRFRGVLVFADEQTGRHGRFSVVSPQIENDEITGMRFGAANESARLNLAVLPQWERQHPGAARDALMNLPGMTDSIADAMLDWIDADPDGRQFGAEAGYYAGLRVPYAPRNAAPASLEELMLVRGVTRALLLGADANFNHQLEPEEASDARASRGASLFGARLTWASLLTVYSAERNLNHQGRPRIDLNDDNLEQLHQQLSEVFDQTWADYIVFYRQFGPDQDRPEENTGEPTAIAGPPDAIPQAAPTPDFSVPGRFEIASVLDLIGGRVRVPEAPEPDRVTDPNDGLALEAEFAPEGDLSPEEAPDPNDQTYQIVESPLANDRIAMRRYLPDLLDHATVDRAPVIRGRINVNLAPRAVLLAVPGLDGAIVEQIVAARRSAVGRDDPNRRHATWLLTEGLVDLPQMKAVMPYLTTDGDVYRAQIVGFFDEPGPTARAELVLDATRTPPRQVYYKDLRLLGLGYPLEALGAAPPTSRF